MNFPKKEREMVWGNTCTPKFLDLARWIASHTEKNKMGTKVLQLAMKFISSSAKQSQKGMQHYVNICAQRYTEGEDKLRPITW